MFPNQKRHGWPPCRSSLLCTLYSVLALFLLLPPPVREVLLPIVRHRLRIATIGVHHLNETALLALRYEGDLLAVRPPGRRQVIVGVVGQWRHVTAVRIH